MTKLNNVNLNKNLNKEFTEKLKNILNEAYLWHHLIHVKTNVSSEDNNLIKLEYTNLAGMREYIISNDNDNKEILKSIKNHSVAHSEIIMLNASLLHQRYNLIRKYKYISKWAYFVPGALRNNKDNIDKMLIKYIIGNDEKVDYDKIKFEINDKRGIDLNTKINNSKIEINKKISKNVVKINRFHIQNDNYEIHYSPDGSWIKLPKFQIPSTREIADGDILINHIDHPYIDKYDTINKNLMNVNYMIWDINTSYRLFQEPPIKNIKDCKKIINDEIKRLAEYNEYIKYIT